MIILFFAHMMWTTAWLAHAVYYGNFHQAIHWAFYPEFLLLAIIKEYYR